MIKKEVIVPADDLVCLGKDKLQELIRCKDCKYFVDEEDQSYCIEMMYGQCSGNGFCAWAERKDE